MRFLHEELIERLKSLANPQAVAGMARFGMNAQNTLGISIPILRGIAKEIGKDHDLAQKLWESGIHEARILAPMIDDPKEVTEEQMERWVQDFDSWDVCDQCCFNLFDKTPFAYQKVVEWSARDEEFVKRASFALMSRLAWTDKKAGDEQLEAFFSIIVAGATDDRNFVKKSVNWALRQIGKRNLTLNQRAIQVAQDIQKLDSRSARWVAADALRELTSEAVQGRLRRQER